MADRTETKIFPAYDPDTKITPQFNIAKYAPVRTRDTRLMAPLTFGSGQVFNSLRLNSATTSGPVRVKAPARSKCVLHKGW